MKAKLIGQLTRDCLLALLVYGRREQRMFQILRFREDRFDYLQLPTRFFGRYAGTGRENRIRKSMSVVGRDRVDH